MESKRVTVLELIRPILVKTYGKSAMVEDIAAYLAERIAGWEPLDDDDRERMIARTCWDWFPGGSTAQAVARKIEAALVEEAWNDDD